MGGAAAGCFYTGGPPEWGGRRTGKTQFRGSVRTARSGGPTAREPELGSCHTEVRGAQPPLRRTLGWGDTLAGRPGARGAWHCQGVPQSPRRLRATQSLGLDPAVCALSLQAEAAGCGMYREGGSFCSWSGLEPRTRQRRHPGDVPELPRVPSLGAPPHVPLAFMALELPLLMPQLG